jgi:hypothetical protein
MNPFCEIAVEEAIRMKEKGIAKEVFFSDLFFSRNGKFVLSCSNPLRGLVRSLLSLWDQRAPKNKSALHLQWDAVGLFRLFIGIISNDLPLSSSPQTFIHVNFGNIRKHIRTLLFRL